MTNSAAPPPNAIRPREPAASASGGRSRAARWRQWLVAGVLLLGSGWLFLGNLGDQCLWQDEAQTALIAKTILTGGVPRGYDGVNFFSQELGREYGRNYLYRWHTWLSFYLAAGSFAALGVSTLAARLPFALCGLGAVALAYVAARSFWGSRRIAVLAAIVLSTCVPFLILSRQCRYYSPCAFLSLLGLLAYHCLLQRRRWAAPVFVMAAVLLFHCHYPYWGVLLAATLVHAAFFHRDRLRAVATWSGCTLLLNLPWLIWLLSPPAVGQYPDVAPSVVRPFQFGARYVGAIFHYVFSPAFVAVVVIVALVYAIRDRRLRLPGRETGSVLALLLIFVAADVVAMSLLTPLYFFRYLVVVIPALSLIAAVALDAAIRLHRICGPALAAAALVASVLLGPMQDYVYELTHHYRGPTEGMVEFLRAHASPKDVVAITYGDLPLKFYTGLRVVGGLTGEDLSPALKAKWVVLRHNIVDPKDLAVMQYLTTHLREDDFRAIPLGCPDIPYDNRENPEEHLYRTVTEALPVVILERIAN